MQPAVSLTSANISKTSWSASWIRNCWT